MRNDLPIIGLVYHHWGFSATGHSSIPFSSLFTDLAHRALCTAEMAVESVGKLEVAPRASLLRNCLLQTPGERPNQWINYQSALFYCAKRPQLWQACLPGREAAAPPAPPAPPGVRGERCAFRLTDGNGSGDFVDTKFQSGSAVCHLIFCPADRSHSLSAAAHRRLKSGNW